MLKMNTFINKGKKMDVSISNYSARLYLLVKRELKYILDIIL